MSYKVLLVDDDMLVRMGMRNAVDWAAMNLEIAGEASDGGEALELMEKLWPNIVITDMYMPKYDGLRFIREAQQKYPDAVFVVISCHNDFQYIKESMRLGVYDYLLKSSIVNTNELERLLENIVDMLDGRKKQKKQNEEELLLPVERQLMSYLNGQILLKETLIPQLKPYGIDVNSNTHFIAVLRPDDYGAMLANFGSIELFEYGVQNILQEIVDKYGSGIVLPRWGKLFAVLLSLSTKNSIVTPTDKAISICEWIRINIKNSLKNTCCVYCSAPYALGDLPNIFPDLLNQISAYSEIYFDSIVNLNELSKNPVKADTIELSQSEADPIAPVIDYIHQNYRNQITLEELASISNLSKYYLCKRFKDKTNTSIINYLVQVRIDKAKELLLQDRKKVFAVAQEVGFNDASYFNRVFKKETGCTPKEFVELNNKLL